MPRVDGPTLVRKVRETHPDLKVIFISGYTEDAFRKKLGEEEGIHFLPKPFSLKQLAAKVKEVIEEGGGPHRSTASSSEGEASAGHMDAEASPAAGRPARKLSTLSPAAANLMKATLNGSGSSAGHSTGHSTGHASGESPGNREAGE